MSSLQIRCHRCGYDTSTVPVTAEGQRDGLLDVVHGSPGASGANPESGAQETLYQSLQKTVHLATHVRCKFYRINRGVEQWLDYPRDIAMLKAAGYNGFCSVVYEGNGDERADVAKAVAYLRGLLAL